ncbi:MAG: CehA/McbA family metallohydrolase [Myxococcota bacterium]
MVLLLACTAPSPGPVAEDPADGPADVARPADGWLRGDLHFHTNYSDDAREQQGDWMGPALDIADAWRDPEWQAAFPQYAPDDHLQFVAVTDHRTDAGWSDPDFGHDFLAVLNGEEFGSDGHAGIWGAAEHVPHEPQAGEDANSRIADAIDEAHATGGLFSVNHPLSDGDLWAWDVAGFDAVEVWNGPWSVLGMPTDEAAIDAWVGEHGGFENPWIRAAARVEGVPQNGQALRFWYAALADGEHPAPVGGGDRHMIFPAGLPTTYVAAADASPEAVLAGIAVGATFVSRGPQGPQVVLEAEVAGERYAMGAALPAGEVTVRWRVGRAAGGELRLVGGPLGEDAPATLTTISLATADESGTWTWTPPEGGGWLHAVVVDPLPDVPAEAQGVADAMLVFPDASGVTATLGAIAPLVDLEVLADPGKCDTGDWSEWGACCMPTDTEPYGTFYVPDTLQRLMSAEFADGAPTGFAMGAVSAAFVTGG